MPDDQAGAAVSGIGEPAVVRWKRRAVSIPAMLGTTAVALLAAPLIATGLATADLFAGRPLLPRVRLYVFTLQYLFNDSVEVLAAPWLWLIAGLGTRIDSRASRRRHARLQRWSIDLLARRAEQLLGLRVEVEGTEQLLPAPAIVLNRHVSVADSSLPAYLYGAWPVVEVRGVIMAEMLADPGFDLIYGRLGSVFVNRDRGTHAQAAIRRMGKDLDDSAVAVICPEGRLFAADALERALGRLAESAPHRAQRLAGLRHVLPPRPGGVISLLEGAPETDVVIIEHAGFEQLPSLAELSRRAPVGQAIKVRVRRVRRSQIPDTPERRIEWLDQEWIHMDDWIESVSAAATR